MCGCVDVGTHIHTGMVKLKLVLIAPHTDYIWQFSRI